MKKTLLIGITIVLFLAACNKNDAGEIKRSAGIITGFDGSKCYCCWGWIVEIDNVIYKFDKIPPSSSVDLNNISYPVPVNIEWRPSAKNCSIRIEVISISQ